MTIQKISNFKKNLLVTVWQNFTRFKSSKGAAVTIFMIVPVCNCNVPSLICLEPVNAGFIRLNLENTNKYVYQICVLKQAILLIKVLYLSPKAYLKLGIASMQHLISNLELDLAHHTSPHTPLLYPENSFYYVKCFLVQAARLMVIHVSTRVPQTSIKSNLCI